MVNLSELPDITYIIYISSGASQIMLESKLFILTMQNIELFQKGNVATLFCYEEPMFCSFCKLKLLLEIMKYDGNGTFCIKSNISFR